MRQTKLTLALIALTTIFFSCQKDISLKNTSATPEEELMCANPTPPPPLPAITYCGTATTVPIFADQHTDNVGSVTIGNDGTNLYVTYEFTGDYKGKATRLYVGTLAGLPLSSGHANSSQFPYKTTHYNEVTSFRYTIPLASLPTCYIISAYAQVIRRNAWGWTCYDETGWLKDRLHTTCSNWSMYLNYCTVSCAPPPPDPDPEK